MRYLLAHQGAVDCFNQHIRGRGSLWEIDSDHNSVAAPGHSLNESGLICRVSQSRAKLLDRAVDVRVEFYDGVVRPKPLSNLFAGDQVSIGSQQHLQNAELLLSQTPLPPRTVQLSRLQVQPERTEANELVHGGVRHQE